MITFHPTIPFRAYIERFFTRSQDPNPRLSALFPGHDITLTDSGRSALAVIIETLGLQRKRLALPAYLCDNILPVLERYEIEPIFLDIDPLTYQPGEDGYETPCDAALIVATYGRLPDQSIVQKLRNRGITIIEDWAHVPLPTTPIDRLDGDARYYSLSKTLPVPDGGLAVTPKNHGFEGRLPRPDTTLTALKDVKKLFWFNATIIMYLRLLFSRKTQGSRTSSWSGPASMRRWSRRYLGHALNKPMMYGGYCRPVRLSDPVSAQRRLFRKGIIAERLWDHPIMDAAQLDRTAFPNTDDAAQHTLCVPLWHIRTEEELQRYEQKLEEALPDEFRNLGKKA